MWKPLLDRWLRSINESSQTYIRETVTEGYIKADWFDFYRYNIPKFDSVLIIIIGIVIFWFISRLKVCISHVLAAFITIGILYLIARTNMSTYGKNMINYDRKLQFLNAIMFTDYSQKWNGNAGVLGNPDASFNSPNSENKTYMYLYPIAVDFFYDQRSWVFIHYGGYQKSLSNMNTAIEQWWKLKHEKNRRVQHATYNWFLTSCTNCYNAFAEIYEGVTLTEDFQSKYRDGLATVGEILQGLREDINQYLSDDFKRGKDIDIQWFTVENNRFPQPNDCELPDAFPWQSYIPTQ